MSKMAKESVKEITILLDLKKNRISITRKIFQIIDNPEYILLLVSPEERMLVVSHGDSSDKRAHRVPPLKAEGKRKREVVLCSKSLMSNILSIAHGWQDGASYRVRGEFISNENILRFHVDNAILLKQKEAK